MFHGFIFILILVPAFSGCASKSVKKEVLPEYSYYELCFYFLRTPEGTTEEDVAEAAFLYAEHLENSNVTVFKRRNCERSACFFIDTVPDFSKPVRMSGNNISQYLLNAGFEKESASLFGIDNVNNKFDLIFAEFSQRSVLPIYLPVEEGLILSGNNRKLLLLSRYLQVLHIEHQFGINDRGELILNLIPDVSKRWMMVPFLFRSLDLENFISPKPGDYSILSECDNSQVSIEILVPWWKKTDVPVVSDQSIGKEDSLFFSTGLLSMPFNDDVVLRYLYSLALSHLLPPSPGLFYSPGFIGGTVGPKLLLLSSEFSVEGEIDLTAEKILLWILSVDSQSKYYPDTFYANILSLRLAKKLYTDSSGFLGGSELFVSTSSVPFEAIRKYFFNKGNVSVFGSIENALYLNFEEIILEYPSFRSIEKTEGMKAFYGSPEMSEESIVSIVFRAKNSFEIKSKVKKLTKSHGFNIIQTLYEQISENDSWASVSFRISKDSEKDFLDIYRKKIKKMDKSMSLGVYRVPK